MDRVIEYREIIAQVFDEWVRWPRKEAGFIVEPLMDAASDRYLLATVGWNEQRRIYSVLIHIDIIDGKLWIQHDGTETGIANQLVDSGIPKKAIVLAYQSPEWRKQGDFALG